MTTANPQTATTADTTLHIARTFDAPRETVYQAFTEPAAFARWWGPEGVTVPTCELDVRPGGRWRTCMHLPDGNDIWVGGAYREVVPPERLVFTWAWETDGVPGAESLVTLTFKAAGEKTELSVLHEGFTDAETRDKHNQGWSGALGCLERELAQ